ncbi:MAG TPA: LysM peptidoglycan-binding domain-containing protein, partial [Rhizomicrobium sp.]|nr:LysM peptidoglycan-binding domain-containing protein [Rhizomicrobium sp.]
MVAIVSGLNLGVSTNSGFVIGSRGQVGSAAFGPDGEDITVNAATGNLNITRNDEIVIGGGVPVDIVRNYNSLGGHVDDNGDNWNIGNGKVITGLVGSAGAAGSYVYRVDWDGSRTKYAFNGTNYVSTAGGDAYDTLSYVSDDTGARWVWTDGATNTAETYSIGTNPNDPTDTYWGRLYSSVDVDGNAVAYSWSGNKLVSIFDAASETVNLVYDTTPGKTNNLIAINTLFASGSETRTQYTYGASNRLMSVITDLTPTDNSITDGKTFVTSYTYDTAGHVLTISQTGGIAMTFTYDTSGRVASYTPAGGGTTNIVYSTGSTTVTDPLGNVTVLLYNTDGTLSQIKYGVVSGTPTETNSFSYTTNGQVATMVDGNGNTTTYTYDGRGNTTKIVYPTGAEVDRAYTTSGPNLLLTETTYADAAKTKMSTVRYAYDSLNRLAYVVSAMGEVTQFLYTTISPPTSTIVYRANTYNISGLAAGTSIAKSLLDSWVAAITDKSTTERTDTVYDFRGNLFSQSTYSQTDTSGNGVHTAQATFLNYVYDAYGNLVSRHATSGGTETYAYDGLGRVISHVTPSGATTTTTYSDASLTVTMAVDNGRSQVSTYDTQGELIQTRVTGALSATEQENYAYDADGNLRMTTDTEGNKTYYIYDQLNRKVADIDSNGDMTEYKYTAESQLQVTIRYATPMTGMQLASLVDGSGNPTSAGLSTLRPATSLTADGYEWRIYDGLHRLVEIITSAGTTDVFTYDNQSNQLSSTISATGIAPLAIHLLETSAPPTTISAPPANALDDVQQEWYDADGRVIGRMNADDYLTVYVYDDASEVVQQTTYANPVTPAANFGSMTITTSARDVTTRYVYTAEGRLKYTLDANLVPTEYDYDNQGHLLATLQYDAAIAAPAGGVYTAATVATQIAALSSPAVRGQWSVYNRAGQMIESIDADGTVTDYTYDDQDNVTSTKVYANVLSAATLLSFRATPPTAAQTPAPDAATDRSTRYFYDESNREIGVLDPASGAFERITYNDLGQKSGVYNYANPASSTYRAAGTYAQVFGSIVASSADNVTQYFYSNLGQLRFAVDADLGVTEYQYDSFGRAAVTYRYDAPIAAPTGTTTWSTAYVAGQISSLGLRADRGTQSQWAIYDTVGRIVQTIDGTGTITAYTYDTKSTVLTATVYATQLSAATIASYQATPPTTAISVTPDATRDQTVHYVRDADDRLVYTVDGNRVPTEYHYNAQGQVISTYQYSGAIAVPSSYTPANVASAISTAGLASLDGVQSKWTFYDLDGRAIQTVDGNGNTVNYSYDALGNLMSTHVYATRAAGATLTALHANPLVGVTPVANSYTDETEQYTYNNSGQATSATDGDGLVTHTTYNAFGQEAEVNGATDVHYFYDVEGRLKYTVDGNLVPTQYDYNVKGDLIDVIHYDGSIALIGGAKTADVATAISTAHLATLAGTIESWTVYDALGRNLESIDSTGSVTTFTYDSEGHLVAASSYSAQLSSTTISGFKTTPPTSIALPTGGTISTTRYFYDQNGNQIGTLDADGYLTGAIYDAFGNKIEDLAYVNKPTNTTGNFAAVSGSVPAPNLGRFTRYYYDLANQLKYTVDATQAVTEYDYDGAGNVVEIIQYGGMIGGTPATTTAGIASQITSQSLANAQTRRSFFVYDADGHAIYTIDAGGSVAASTYDGTGHLASTTVYSHLRATTSEPTAATMASWVSTNASASSDRTTSYYYDATGKLLFEKDALNYVTRHVYNSLGERVSDIRYADNTYGINVTTGYPDVPALGSTPATALVTTYAYDPVGQLTDSTDGDGFVTHYVYDALGNVLQKTVAYGTADAETTLYAYDAWGRETQCTDPTGAVTKYGYDGLGNRITVIDPAGTTTTYAFDAMGRVKTSSTPVSTTPPLTALVQYFYDAYGDVTSQIDANGNTTTYGYDAMGRLTATAVSTDAGAAMTQYQRDAFGDVIKTTLPLLNAVYDFYDVLGRKVATIDGAGYATQYTYDFAGDLLSSTRNVAKVTATITPGVLPTITSNPTTDETTSYGYDQLGRETSMTDALSKSETYQLDAFGNVLKLFNKLTAETDMTYNKRGLLLSETMVGETAYNANSSVEATAITNSYTYDGRGNLKTQVLLSNVTADARTTTFTYDGADRLKTSTTDSVDNYTGATWSDAGSAALQTSYFYDSRGNLIEQDSPSGARTLYYYDLANLKVAQIVESDMTAGTGTLSTFTYDANGNMTVEQVYAALVTLPALGAAQPAASGACRTTTYAYTADNRLKKTTVSGTNLASWYQGQTANSPSTAAIITATNSYDLNGNLISVKDADGNVTHYYYDLRDIKTAEVDEGMFLTSYQLDWDGNVVKETRYANALTSLPPTGIPTQTPDTHNNDRITDFQYDKLGRRTVETRENVGVMASFSAGWNTSASLDPSVSLAGVEIDYSYDALGDVTGKTQVGTGDKTSYVYDNFGRQTTDSTLDGVGTLYDKTTQYYNGFGELVRTVEGAATGTQRTTQYTYDKAGRLASTIDPGGKTRTNHYDKDGDLIVSEYTRTSSTGVTENDADLYQYDAAGHMITQAKGVKNTSGVWVTTGLDVFTMKYDAFGDVVQRGSQGMTQESYVYDDAGRLIQSTTNDGVKRFFLYDADGNQTAMIEPSDTAMDPGSSWSTVTQAQLITLLTATNTAAIGTVNVNGVVLTIYNYDQRGQQTSVVQPFRQLTSASTATITTSKTYNAFGEITSQTDGKGNLTKYIYNTLGKVSETDLPAVTIAYANGTASASAISPTVKVYYDASGRAIASVDADGNKTERTLLAGTGYDGSAGLSLLEHHDDASVYHSAYDAFGDVVTRNVNGIYGAVGTGAAQEHDETLVYDAMGNLTELDHAMRTDGTQLIDHYTYDELGQRLTHTNNQGGITGFAAETADYDAQGRVTQTKDFLGDVTTTSYSWSAALAMGGVTVGGWTKTVTLGSLTTWESDDYFGHMLAQNTGTYEFDYTYDQAGRQVLETNTWADPTGGGFGVPYTSTVTSYFNTGLVSSVYAGRNTFDSPNDFYENTAYGYDKDGNRTYEYYSRSVSKGVNDSDTGGIDWNDQTTVYEDATIGWDADNRMTSYVEIDNDAPVNITYTYDANGNIREMKSYYDTVSATGTMTANPTPQDFWYTYDAMNRFVVTMGKLESGGVIDNGTGTTAIGSTVTYDSAGNRATVVTANGTTTDTQNFTYSNDGYLTQVKVNGVVRANYTVDAMGRTISVFEYDSSGSWVYEHGSTINAIGEVTSDWTNTITGSSASETDSTSTYTYDSAGLVTEIDGSTTINQYTPSKSTSYTVTNYGYARFENGPVQTFESINTYTDAAHTHISTAYSTEYDYDPLGHLERVHIGDGQPRYFDYVTDLNGQIMRRDLSVAQSLHATIVRWVDGSGPHDVRYFANGLVIGDVTDDGASDNDYAQAIADRTAVQGPGIYHNGTTSGMQQANFDASYDPINGFQSATSSVYTVSTGDTLQSIAQMTWGDSSLWYLIADANGLSASDTLVAGQSLNIPNKVANVHNNTSTFQVYDPNDAIGNVDPTRPKPKKSSTPCGVFGQILQAIISIVVQVVATPFVGPEAAAILGDVAGQLFGMAIGNQKSFNWDELGKAAISGFIGGPDAAASVPVQIAEAALLDVASQGVALAVGLQKKFDWTEVATSAAAAGAGAEADKLMGETTFGIDDPNLAAGVRFAVRVTARDLASAATTTLIKGTDFGDNIVSALPGAVGSALNQGLQENTSLQTYLKSAAANSPFAGVADALTPPTLSKYLNPQVESLAGEDPEQKARFKAYFAVDLRRASYVDIPHPAPDATADTSPPAPMLTV